MDQAAGLDDWPWLCRRLAGNYLGSQREYGGEAFEDVAWLGSFQRSEERGADDDIEDQHG